MIASLVTAFALAVVLGGLGFYGWNYAPDLVPGWLEEDQRYYKERAVRRGAAACALLAVVLPVVAVLLAVAR